MYKYLSESKFHVVKSHKNSSLLSLQRKAKVMLIKNVKFKACKLSELFACLVIIASIGKIFEKAWSSIEILDT